MCAVCLTRCRIAHLFSVTVVSGDQQLSTHGLNCFRDFFHAVIQRFNRFNRRFHHPGVTYHVAVRIVTDNGVVFAALDCRNQFFGQFAELISGCRS